VAEINSGWEMAFPCYKISELLSSLSLSIKKEEVGGSPEQIPDDNTKEQKNPKLSKHINPTFCRRPSRDAMYHCFTGGILTYFLKELGFNLLNCLFYS